MPMLLQAHRQGFHMEKREPRIVRPNIKYVGITNESYFRWSENICGVKPKLEARADRILRDFFRSLEKKKYEKRDTNW